MSVTSQLKSIQSPVNIFFQKHCKKNGHLIIQKTLKDSRKSYPEISSFRPVNDSVLMMFGLICDYLIKQQLGGRLFSFEDAVIGEFPSKNLIPTQLVNLKQAKTNIFRISREIPINMQNDTGFKEYE